MWETKSVEACKKFMNPVKEVAMKSTIVKPLLFSLMLVSPIFSVGTSISMAAESVGEYVDDATITTSVKAKLTAEKAANFTKISVKTTNNVVSLTGEVDSKDQKERAEKIAKQVNGVKRVDNKLQIKAQG
jgi:hyperosmotically inducible periplasmic protein